MCKPHHTARSRGIDEIGAGRFKAAPLQDVADRQFHLVLQGNHLRIKTRCRCQKRAKTIAGLRPADDIKILHRVRERASIDVDDLVLDRHEPLWQEREAVVKTGGGHDHVVLAHSAVREVHLFAGEALDVWARLDTPLPQVVEQVGAVGGMARK